MSAQFTPTRLVPQSPLHRWAAEATAALRSRFASERKVRLAQARVRYDAALLRHDLGCFLQEIDRPAYEIARCVACGAGVSVHLATGETPVSDLLGQPCVLAAKYEGSE